MSGPAFEVVLRIANRQITEHLSWDDLLSLSRTSPHVKNVIIHFCAPFEGDNVRMCDGRGTGDGRPAQHYDQALDQLAELPVASRLFISHVPISVNKRIVEAIERCGSVNHISYINRLDHRALTDLVRRLSPAAAARITSLDLISYPPDGSRLTSKSFSVQNMYNFIALKPV